MWCRIAGGQGRARSLLRAYHSAPQATLSVCQHHTRELKISGTVIGSRRIMIVRSEMVSMRDNNRHHRATLICSSIS